MTTPHLSIEAAAETLGRYGYTVKKHGARWLAAQGAESPKVFDTDQLIRLAAEYVESRQPAPSTAPAAPDDSLPLGALLGALDTHAQALPKPLPTTHSIPRPAGLPERFLCPIDLVTPGRYQPRTTFDAAELAELAASIAEHGILTPLMVVANEAGRLELVAGERRLRAARQLGLRFVPVDVRSMTLRQVAEISGLDNIQRANLSPAEEGAYFSRLLAELGISENELSKRLGKNRAYIQQRRAIASAAPEVLAALADGELTFSQARAIAQAAPGQPKAQAQALTKVRELTKSGKRVTETEAKNVTEKIVLTKAKKDLEALGWSVEVNYSYTLIFAQGERPRVWTGPEILEAVAAQRRPASGEAQGKASTEDMAAVRARYRRVDTRFGWIGLATGWSDAPTFYAPGEIAAVATLVREELAALAARYAASGWILATRDDTEGHFDAKGTHGGYRSLWGWDAAVDYVAQIEAGKVKDESALASTYRQPSYVPKCSACKRESGTLQHIDGRTLCADCAAPIVAAQQARLSAARQRVDRALGPWLRAAPAGALAFLVAAIVGDAIDENETASNLLDQAAHYLDSIDDYLEAGETLADAEPTVAALLDRPAADHLLITEWSADEAASYVGQAPRAADSLDADGYATVAQAVRLLAQALAPTPAAEPAAAPGSSPAAPHTTPIDRIRVTLDAIARWWDTVTEDTPAEEIRVNLAELRVLAKDLETYADAPDLSDAAYEALAHQIGDLVVQLDEVLASIREVAP